MRASSTAIGWFRSFVLAPLVFLPLACTDASPAAGPSRVVTELPVAELVGKAQAGMRSSRITLNRRNVVIDPPGQYVSNFVVVGDVDAADVPALLDALAAEVIAGVTERGATLTMAVSTSVDLPAGLQKAITAQDPLAGETLLARHAAYECDGRAGAITLIAVPAREPAGAWLVAGGVHER